MMDRTYWRKQSPDQPLFPELQWSRPENKQFAGKLTIIGGNLHGFAAPAEAYSEADKAGIGTSRVLLPDAVRNAVKGILPELEYAPSTPSGSFSQDALEAWLDLAQWGDGVLLTGDLGRNSETAIVFESFVQKYRSPLIITKDASDYAIAAHGSILNRPETTLVISTAQAQKLFMAARSTTPITLTMDLMHFVEALHSFTAQHPLYLVTKFHDTFCVAVGGEVVTMRLKADIPIWRVKAATHISVWWLQNPTKPLEALVTGLTELSA